METYIEWAILSSFLYLTQGKDVVLDFDQV